MFSNIRFRLFVASLLAVFAGNTALSQRSTDYSGPWMMAGEGSDAKLILYQDGQQLWGAFESGDGRQVWNVRGEVKRGGTIEMTRYIPISELGNTPEPALSSVFEEYGMEDRFGFLRGRVVLRPSSDGLTGYYTRINAAFYSDSGKIHDVTEVNTEVDLVRADHLPDLKVENLSVISKTGGPSGTYWAVTAEIVNSGGSAPSENIVLNLERTGRLVEGQAPTWEEMAFSRQTIGALSPGARAKVTWSEIRPLDGAPQPVRLDPESAALQLHIDPDSRFDEQSKRNNFGEMERVQCEDGQNAPRHEVTWIAQSESSGTPATSREDSSGLQAYEALFENATDPAKAVLCYIKMDAKRRAGQHNRTVLGSEFYDQLTGFFLKPYLIAPNPVTGLLVLTEIGSTQGAPRLGLGIGLYVPDGLRARYDGVPEWLYPATQFFVSGSFEGLHVDKIPYLDIPFLVGDANTSLMEDADFLGGGKNLSNVMHWATGAKYWEVPRSAFRELFIGYEYWHMEGIDVFGEDAINDLISEYAGYLMGKRIIRGDIRSRSDLGRKLDADFYEARAWVGGLLRERAEHFDELILQELLPRSEIWFGYGGRGLEIMAPWGRHPEGNTVRHMIANDKSAKEVAETEFVEHLVEVYTLIYEATEWEKANGSIGLTNVERSVMAGQYNAQFRAAAKGWGDEWNWRP
jgi:hypothetical protein